MEGEYVVMLGILIHTYVLQVKPAFIATWYRVGF